MTNGNPVQQMVAAIANYYPVKFDAEKNQVLVYKAQNDPVPEDILKALGKYGFVYAGVRPGTMSRDITLECHAWNIPAGLVSDGQIVKS